MILYNKEKINIVYIEYFTTFKIKIIKYKIILI